jgi:hypothetical protein
VSGRRTRAAADLAERRADVVGVAHGLADDPLPDVLAWERAEEVVGGAPAWAVSLCFCRHEAEHLGRACEAPHGRAIGRLPPAQAALATEPVRSRFVRAAVGRFRDLA